MAHVQIKSGEGVSGSGSVVIDGVDLSTSVLADGFSIVPSSAHTGGWHVTMTIAADSLDVDLPDAVVSATRLEAS